MLCEAKSISIKEIILYLHVTIKMSEEVLKDIGKIYIVITS